MHLIKWKKLSSIATFFWSVASPWNLEFQTYVFLVTHTVARRAHYSADCAIPLTDRAQTSPQHYCLSSVLHIAETTNHFMCLAVRVAWHYLAIIYFCLHRATSTTASAYLLFFHLPLPLTSIFATSSHSTSIMSPYTNLLHLTNTCLTGFRAYAEK